MEKRSRRPEWIPDRKPFPKAVQVEVLKRSGGVCEMEGCSRVGKEFDHYPKAVAFGGPSTLENCRLLCRECNQETGVETGRDAAKADRQGGRSGKYAKRQRAKAIGKHKAIPSRPMPGTKASGLKKKMDGTVIRRTT